MSIFEAIVLGLIQGLTEFIPVSSSGHLLLAHEVFGSETNTIAFDLALHIGTLLALFIFFRKDIMQLASNVFSSNKDGRLARLLVIATIPGGLVGLLFGDYIEDNLRSPAVVAIMLAAVAILMLLADKYANASKSSEVSTQQGVKIGFAQALALVPGVSRSGITITMGLFSGLDRVKAARFSFLLAIPIISGSALGFMLKDSPVGVIEVGDSRLLIGVVTAFASGLLAIRFLLGVIARVGLKPFAFYRLALAAVVLATLV